MRIAFAIVVGLVAASMHYFRPSGNGGLSDFSGVWYGSNMLLHGQNPYELIGPGRHVDLPSFLYYPAPALVAVSPFTLLSVESAGAAFIFVSAALLAYGITREGWYRLPVIASIPFMNAARLGQWSILLTAGLFLPWVAFFSAVKPQTSLPVLAGATSRRTIPFAVAGIVILSILGFILLPDWVPAWFRQLSTSQDFRPPFFSIGGIAIALVLLRWKRPEAWIVFTSACVPQTWYPYNALILLTVAWTYREACVLSLLSSLAWLAAYYFAPGESRSPETQSLFRAVMIAFCFLPATIVVLRRPNVGPSPAWLAVFLRRNGAQRDV
jgi:hypothetical protein